MSQTTTTRTGEVAGMDLEEYRARTREWLAANLKRRIGPARIREIDYYTPEVMATARALQKKLYEAGYAGISYPKEYGGQGLGPEFEAVFLEESKDYEVPDFGIVGGTTFGVCVPVMIEHGQPEFLVDFIPKVLRGEALVCQFFSEPSSGSDLAGARTRATRDGDMWVINGQKIWSTYAHLADWGLCLARSDWDLPKHRGLTWFAIPCDAPGVTIRPIRQINDTSEFCEDFFDDVHIPDLYRIGELNEGWRVAQTMLVRERGAGRPADKKRQLHPGTLAPDLVELARRAGTLGDPVVRQKIAQAHTNDFVQQCISNRIGELALLGQLDTGAAAYGKLFSGIYNPIRARLAVEIGGAGALTWDPADPKGAETSLYYLNCRIMAIAGGTNEMQRNGISERKLGMPREPSYDTGKPFNQVLKDAKNWTGTS